MAIGEVATRDYLRGELDRLRSDLDEMANPGSTDKPAKRAPDKGKSRSKSPAKPQPPQARRQKDPYPDVEPGQVPGQRAVPPMPRTDPGDGDRHRHLTAEAAERPDGRMEHSPGCPTCCC